MSKQLPLFPQTSFNVVKHLKEAMALGVEKCGLSRDEIVDQMNDLAERYGVSLAKGYGSKLTLATLEKWVNPADKVRVIPMKAFPIFNAVVGDVKPMQVLSEPHGWRVINDKEVTKLEWAEQSLKAKKARMAMKKLEAEL